LSKIDFEIISKAPARICLFGDHQDYLNLPVIACTINRYIEIKASPNNSNFFKIYKTDLNQIDIIEFRDPLIKIQGEDYLRLALKVVKRYGCNPNKGYDIYISGDIPINAGLSSSSALTIAWIQFLISIFKASEPLSSSFLSRLAYEAEVIEQDSSGGKMDQYAISNGRTIYLNPSNDKIDFITTPIEHLVVGVSGESKDTLGMLSFLKSKSWEAIHKVQSVIPEFDPKNVRIEKIPSYLNIVGEKLKPFLEASILNYMITQKAKHELKKDVIEKSIIGKLMTQHHLLLKENLRITTPKIDLMIEASLNSGAYGAKIVGSGGGGCIVAIANKKNIDQIITNIKKVGAQDAFSVSISKGPSISLN